MSNIYIRHQSFKDVIVESGNKQVSSSRDFIIDKAVEPKDVVEMGIYQAS